MNPLRRLALWVFKTEWIPLGPIPPHVLLGWALGSRAQRVWPECPSCAVALSPGATHADNCEDEYGPFVL